MRHPRPEHGAQREPDGGVRDGRDHVAVDDALRIEVMVAELQGHLGFAVADRDQLHAGPPVEGGGPNALDQILEMSLVERLLNLVVPHRIPRRVSRRYVMRLGSCPWSRRRSGRRS